MLEEEASVVVVVVEVTEAGEEEEEEAGAVNLPFDSDFVEFKDAFFLASSLDVGVSSVVEERT